VATAIGLVLLAAGVALAIGLGGGGYVNLGALLLFVGGVILLADRTGTVNSKRSRRRRRSHSSRSRSSGHSSGHSSGERWLAPLDVVDVRPPPKPHTASEPDLDLDLDHVRDEERTRPSRRRRPGPT
jgi:hypothetical protein